MTKFYVHFACACEINFDSHLYNMEVPLTWVILIPRLHKWVPVFGYTWDIS